MQNLVKLCSRYIHIRGLANNIANKSVFSSQTESGQEKLSLDKFFSTQKDPTYQLTDENALKYMKMAADLSLIRFKDEQEMLQYKNDFQSALMFIKKLEEVDVSGVEPLSNVLEYYGGNDSKMRSYEELKQIDEEHAQAIKDQQANPILKQIQSMNSNMQSSLVKTPRPFK